MTRSLNTILRKYEDAHVQLVKAPCQQQVHFGFGCTGEKNTVPATSGITLRYSRVEYAATASQRLRVPART